MPRIDFDDYEAKISDLMGLPLTDPAREAAMNIWENWDEVIKLLASNSLKIHIEPVMMGHYFPEFNLDRQGYQNRLVTKFRNNVDGDGLANLGAHYIAGTIQLNGPGGSSHWPQHPSNALDGEKSFIDTGTSQISYQSSASTKPWWKFW